MLAHVLPPSLLAEVAKLERMSPNAIARTVARCLLRPRKQLQLLRKVDYADRPRKACLAYFLFNGLSFRSLRDFESRMIRRAAEFGYMDWPRRIREDVRGADILDVGCGTGLHAIGFLVVGVKSYTGLDPMIKVNTDRSKNIHKGGTKERFGWTPAQIQRRLSRVRLISGTFEQMAPDMTFDVAVLHNVTEHLMKIEEVFRGVWERLRPDGIIVFTHHNFYCWNGHHMKPQFVREIDRTDPEQLKFLDWNHLTYEPGPDEYIARRLNRIRLDELRALTERYFAIELWRETASDENRGAGRLTDEIRARFPGGTDPEFTTQNVLCRARKRAVPRTGGG